jgi:hypothetical protein
MMKEFIHGLIVIVIVSLSASCAESDDERLVRPPKDSQEAASELEQAFADADGATKKNAAVATQALREKKYEKAVASIMTIRNQDNLSFDQGMTVRNSMVTLQRELINAAEDGDPRAERAIKILQGRP